MFSFQVRVHNPVNYSIPLLSRIHLFSLHTHPQFHDVDPQTNLVFYSTFSLSSLILLLLFKSSHPSLSSHSMCFISQDLPLESTKYMTKHTLITRLQLPSYHKRNESQGPFTRGCALLMGEQAWVLQGGT